MAPLRDLIGRHVPLQDAAAGQAFSHLLSLLCLASGKDLQIKDLLGALPADSDIPLGEALLAAMANLGFEASRIGERPEMLGDLFGPVLFLDESGENACVIIDDDDGVRQVHLKDGDVIALSEARRVSAGTCWRFRSEHRVHALAAERRQHTGYSWMRALVEHLGVIGITLIGTSLALTVLAMAVPMLVAAFYSQVMTLASIEPLPYFVIACAGVILFKAILLNLRARTLVWTANRLDFLVSTASFDRLLGISAAQSERADPNDQTARLRSFENVRDFLSGPVAPAVLDLPVAILAISVLAFLIPSIAATLAAGAVAYAVLFWVIWRRVRVQTSVVADEATEMQRRALETFSKRDLIRECGLQHRWADLHVRTIAREQKAQAGLQMLGAISESTASFLFGTTLILLLAGSVELVWRGQLNPGHLLAVLLVGLRVLVPFHSACLSVPRFEQARKSLAQINKLMQIPREDETEVLKRKLPPLRGGLTFLNISYRTGDSRPVFVGLDIDIRPGEVIGITGANGAGKSSVLKLAQGLSETPLGTIRIDGIDLRQLPLRELRRRIGYVPQNPQLLPGTLRDNLLYANPLATTEQLERTLAIVGIKSEDAALDRDCHAAGAAPPTIEFRFRFAFAQALLAHSNLFLIDEMPNALLNGELGAMFKRMLAVSGEQRTILFVSHRSDFLSLADRVIALRYGRVPTIVTPDALLKSMA